MAEQEVLAANGRPIGQEGGEREKEGERKEEGRELRTCALRCAGIYGAGEQRHLPRIVVSCVQLRHNYVRGGNLALWG